MTHKTTNRDITKHHYKKLFLLINERFEKTLFSYQGEQEDLIRCFYYDFVSCFDRQGTKRTNRLLNQEQENKITIEDRDYVRDFIFGYLDIFELGAKWERKLSNQNRSEKATNSRMLLGAATRERVKKEADKIRFTTTKSAAAYIIGNKVSKNPGTILRYLTEIFPGDKWKSNASHDT